MSDNQEWQDWEDARGDDLERIRDTVRDLKKHGVTRRQLVRTGGIGALAALLAGSGGLPGAALAGLNRQEQEDGSEKQLYDGGIFDAKGETLRVAEWGGFWQEFEGTTLINKFQKDFNCKVSYDSAWPWFPKFVAGGTGNPPYDVSHWNLPELYKTGASGNFFESAAAHKLNIPNTKHLWPWAKPRYGVMTLFGKYGFSYRKDLLKPGINSFPDFFADRLKGKRGTYITSNTLQHVFFMASSKWYGGNPKNINAGYAAMKKFVPGKISDFTGNMQTLLQRGEVSAAVLDDAENFYLADKGVKLGFYYWDHWKPVLTQTDVVSKGSNETRKKLAYAWINRKLTPEWMWQWQKVQYWRATIDNAKVPPNLAKLGVKNTAAALKGTVIPDWDWWNANETKIVQEVNKIFSS